MTGATAAVDRLQEQSGAYDFVTKPIERDMLAIADERALSHRALRDQVRLLRETCGGAKALEEFIAQGDD